MGRRRPSARALWLLATALQLTLPGAAGWADARLDTPEYHAAAHIESHTSPSCARIHPPDCALCHFLTAPVVAGRAHVFPIAAANQRRTPGADPAVLPHRLSRPHPHPRAPPQLS